MAVKEITIAAKGANPPESWFETEDMIITPALKIIEKTRRNFFLFVFSEYADMVFEIPNCKIISKRKKKAFFGWEITRKMTETRARTEFFRLFGARLKTKSAAGRKR